MLTEALFQEKEKAEDRSQRVLEILQAKDDEIHKLSQENESLKMKLNDAQHTIMENTNQNRLKMHQITGYIYRGT